MFNNSANLQKILQMYTMFKKKIYKKKILVENDC